MDSATDQMIRLANVFSSEISLSKDVTGQYMVHIRRVAWKENRRDIMARSITGRGSSVDNACADYMNQARGRLLFGDDKGYYGDNAPEYICV